MSRVRHKMIITTSLRTSSGAYKANPISRDDIRPLGALMHDAYAGTIDDEDETPEKCVRVMENTMDGKYGPFLDTASFSISIESKIVSATIVTMWEDRPLLVFAITHPVYQGRGMARYLIENSITALAKEGHTELRLVVTEGNTPAQQLYKNMGFTFAEERIKIFK